jgi:serine/threonine protein kinase
MNPKYVNHGTYGCVFRPAVGCHKNKLNSENVSKLFASEEEMFKERTEHKKINDYIDPYNVFTLKLVETCGIDTKKFDDEELDNCRNFNSTPKNKVPQLVYEDGGYDLVDASKKFDFKQIFNGLFFVFKGLLIMEEKKYGHIDIKPANVVFNPVSKRAVLIDFGLSRGIESFYQKEHLFFFKHIYPYYPPEFCIMADFYMYGYNGMQKNLKNRITDNTNWQRMVNNIEALLEIDTNNVELVLLLDSFKQQSFEELVNVFKDDIFYDPERILNVFSNRIDVFGVGSTIAEVLSKCIKSKKTKIDKDNILFYINVIKLIHNMTCISPVKRFTPKQAYAEYKQISRSEKNNIMPNSKSKSKSSSRNQYVSSEKSK